MCRIMPVDVVLDLRHCPVALRRHLEVIHGPVGRFDDKLYRITHLSSFSVKNLLTAKLWLSNNPF